MNYYQDFTLKNYTLKKLTKEQVHDYNCKYFECYLYWKNYGINVKPFIYLYEENNNYYWVKK